MAPAPYHVRRTFIHTQCTNLFGDVDIVALGTSEKGPPRSRAKSDFAVDYDWVCEMSTDGSSRSPTPTSGESSLQLGAEASSARQPAELAGAQPPHVGFVAAPVAQGPVAPSFYLAVPIMPWGMMPVMAPAMSPTTSVVHAARGTMGTAKLTPEALALLSPDELEEAAAELQETARRLLAQRTRSGIGSSSVEQAPGPLDGWGSKAKPGPLDGWGSKARRDLTVSADGGIGSSGFSVMPDAMKTTVMIRNLPNDYSREMLVQLLNEAGFADCFDFVYLPLDFRRVAGVGYAFVNMVNTREAQRIRQVMEGFSDWDLPSQKIVKVCWADPLQGLQACVERYRNSPVMHMSVPDMFKPAVFATGWRVEFPAPTRRIREPRLPASDQ